MTLKQVRTNFGLSQLDAASIVGAPLRTYRRYELEENYGDAFKRKAFIDILIEHCEVTESKGLLTIDSIRSKLTDLFDGEYRGEIEFCYLFGSYARGDAKETSDVDLYVATSLTGLRFVGLIEKARQALHKKVDMLRTSELSDNPDLVHELLKEGVRIYG